MFGPGSASAANWLQYPATSVVQCGANGINTTGVIAAASLNASGAVAAASLTASGAATVNSLSVTGAVNAGSVAASGAATAGSITTAGTATVGTLTTTGAVTAGSVTTSGNAVVASNASIGTTAAPSYTLDVGGFVSGTTDAAIRVTNKTWGKGLQLFSSVPSANAFADYFICRGGKSDGSLKDHLVIHAGNYGGSGIHLMSSGEVSRLFVNTNNGNVGLGATDPKGPLQIGMLDGDKIVFIETNGVPGSKISHTNGWALNFFTGRSTYNDGGSFTFKTSNSSGYTQSAVINTSGLSVTGGISATGNIYPGATYSKNMSIATAVANNWFTFWSPTELDYGYYHLTYYLIQPTGEPWELRGAGSIAVCYTNNANLNFNAPEYTPFGATHTGANYSVSFRPQPWAGTNSGLQVRLKGFSGVTGATLQIRLYRFAQW